jgi:site-specific DNA recombinase
MERLWKGRQERVRRGLPPGGNVPYGFRRNGKGLEVNPIEARIVENIFALAEPRQTAMSVARTLNLAGYVRRNGKPWTQRQVAAIVARADFYRAGAIRYGAVAAVSERTCF